MRQERIELAVPDGVGAGAPEKVERHTGITLLITAAALGGGTLDLMGSIDGAAFFQIDSTISAVGFVTVVETLDSMRIDRVSGASSGEAVDLLAFDQRTQ